MLAFIFLLIFLLIVVEQYYSYGEICVRCGCCSRNTDYRDRVIKIIRYYKEYLKEELCFDNWDDKNTREKCEIKHSVLQEKNQDVQKDFKNS